MKAKFYTTFLCFSSLLCSAQADIRVVKGIVFSNGRPISDVHVTVEGTQNGTQTDEHGFFELTADDKSMLNLTHISFEPKTVRLKKSKDTLKINMKALVEELSEVSVTRGRKKTQQMLRDEYADNPNIIKTKFGYLDKDRSSFSIRMIDGAQLPNINMDVLSAVNMVMPQVRVAIEGSERRAYLRGTSSFSGPVPVIFDLDGQVLLSAPVGLILSEIDRIAIIPSTSAAVRYGVLAAGGVIVINTKTGEQY